MRFPIESIDPFEVFPSLAELPQPPQTLFIRGNLAHIQDKKIIAVVGSRKCTSYGKIVCRMLIEGLSGYPVVIISGLALGIDAIAHETALEVGLSTIAFPGSGLSDRALYPALHRGLAQRILDTAGALVSEYPPETRAAQWTFPNRNRLMAGVADLVLVIEGEMKSGTLITARLGTEYNKIVCAVPGAITASSCSGTNWLIKLGAVPITESKDIVRELGLEEENTPAEKNLAIINTQEARVLTALIEPKSRDQLIDELELEISEANVIFSTLEIKGLIYETMGVFHRT